MATSRRPRSSARPDRSPPRTKDRSTPRPRAAAVVQGSRYPGRPDEPARLLPASLSNRQGRHLKALAHHLDPLVNVGKEGATEGVIAAVSRALVDHELIKVRMPQLDKAERHALAEAIAQGAPAHLVGEVGRIAILYRRHPSTPKVTLPAP